MRSHLCRSVLFVVLLLAKPDLALAHTGAHAAFSFASGLQHPFSGLDHLLAMLAVGLFAAQLGGRSVWLVPAGFVTMMVAGAVVGFSGIEIPGVEYGILVSVIAIALPVAFAFGMPALLATAYVGFFALFHGYAHGAELPSEAQALPYIAGFALATVIIHAVGVAAGLASGRLAVLQGSGLRLAGGLVALMGIGLAVT